MTYRPTIKVDNRDFNSPQKRKSVKTNRVVKDNTDKIIIPLSQERIRDKERKILGLKRGRNPIFDKPIGAPDKRK